MIIDGYDILYMYYICRYQLGTPDRVAAQSSQPFKPSAVQSLQFSIMHDQAAGLSASHCPEYGREGSFYW